MPEAAGVQTYLDALISAADENANHEGQRPILTLARTREGGETGNIRITRIEITATRSRHGDTVLAEFMCIDADNPDAWYDGYFSSAGIISLFLSPDSPCHDELDGSKPDERVSADEPTAAARADPNPAPEPSPEPAPVAADRPVLGAKPGPPPRRSVVYSTTTPDRPERQSA